MKYVGGKQLIGKDISEFLTKKVPPSKVSGYLEPFVGGCGVFQHMIQHNYKKKIGSDQHKSLILMWKALQEKKLKFPKTVNETMWIKYRNSKVDSAMKGLFGFGLSFGGDYFSGYIQKYAGNSGRDFYQELKSSLLKTQKLINRPDVFFVIKSYKDWKPKNYLIYCDPPYKNTTGYKNSSKELEVFDHALFWETIRKWSKTNNVYISEESAPRDFKCVWKKKKFRSLTPIKDKAHHSYEKIFKYSP